MDLMVCQKCGLPDNSPKPLICGKCGGKEFLDSGPSGDNAALAVQKQDNGQAQSPAVVTLFDKYGGVPTIAKLVRAFHKEIMLRPHLAAYFVGIDLEHLAEHTVKYIAYVMGKPAEIYTGRDMYTAHAKYHIHGMHFDEVADVLKDTLTMAGVSKPDIQTVMKRVEGLREMIII